MKVLLSALAFLGLMSAPAMAQVGAEMVAAEEEELFTTIASYDIEMDRGSNTYELLLEEPAEGGQLSVWFNRNLRCRGFQIEGVMVKGTAEDAEFVGTDMTVWDGIAHYNAPENITALMITLRTERIFGQECRIHVRRANFRVPTIVELLAKVQATCDEETETCTYSLIRIDSEEREVITLTEQDVIDFRLQADLIYKIRGYMDIDEESETEFFKLTYAMEIM